MQRTVLTACVSLATVMQTLDTTIANVALPYMRGSLGASQDEINWVLTSYIVAAAIMTAPTGFLAGRYGRKALFVTAIGGFIVASMLCGTAQTISEIVIFRVLQGMFGAALVPLSQATLLDIYPVEQRGFAMALWTLGALIGPILGPTLGGWLTQNYSWRWVFYINVPIGMLAGFGLLSFLDDTERSREVKLDWLGFLAISIAIGAFQTMLDRGEEMDWFGSREIITEAVIAGLGLYIFLVQSYFADKPFLALALFKDMNFTIGITLYFIVGLILYANMALLAPYLQTLMNYPVSTAGLVMAPRGLGSMLAAIICGRFLRIVDARLLLTLGFIASAYVQYEMTGWTPDVSEWTVVTTGFIQGIGISCLSVPLTTVTFSTLLPSLRTEATGVYSLMRNLGSSIGISVTGALLVRNTQINHAILSANITPFNRLLQDGRMPRYWAPETAHGAALLNQEITRQASVISYRDDFVLMLILTLLSLPLVLLISPGIRPVRLSGTENRHKARGYAPGSAD
ncbi:MAG: DHA2 family efflux MFS transporter permease subunit [Acidocella sp.]|nr:DHA2 family efflux MFS transporter permease subunit [Acidocella sp.]